MIVVADTSPLNYLILIEEIDVLPLLYGTVLVPPAVYHELRDDRSPSKVKDWILSSPAWLEIRQLHGSTPESLMELDLGEKQAIQLALELKVQTILLDELDGRTVAEQHHLEPRGTLGILEDAAVLEVLDFRAALGKLMQTTFRASPALIAKFLARAK